MATTIVQTNMAPVGKVTREWSSGLCDCFKDMEICLCGFFCSSCLLFRNASQLGESGFCLACFIPPPYGQVLLRMKLRTENGIKGDIGDDCCYVTCCPSCALCQEAREIKFVRMNPGQGANSLTVVTTQPTVQPVAIQPANVQFQPVGVQYHP